MCLQMIAIIQGKEEGVMKNIYKGEEGGLPAAKCREEGKRACRSLSRVFGILQMAFGLKAGIANSTKTLPRESLT